MMRKERGFFGQKSKHLNMGRAKFTRHFEDQGVGFYAIEKKKACKPVMAWISVNGKILGFFSPSRVYSIGQIAFAIIGLPPRCRLLFAFFQGASG